MTSPVSEVQTILAPYFDHPTEIHYYNTNLVKTIEIIQELLPILNEQDHHEVFHSVNRLRARIDTNNHFVQSKRKSDPNFTIYSCTGLQDFVGLKYLLRTDADPNEIVNGKAAIHIAASRGLKDFVELLMISPKIDLSLRTKNGKTALELAKTEEIRQLLSSKIS